jgi:hypothetical protein
MSRQLRESYDVVLLIGDPHVRKEDIREARKFIEFIVNGVRVLEKTMGHRKVLPVFMGDQMNDFALARAEVLAFWKWAYDQIRAIEPDHDSLSLEGNHDMNQEESASTMCVYDERTVLAGKKPVFINSQVAAIGFIRKEELFYQAAMSAYAEGARTILCHAEFDGAKYESGTYAPNGFKLDRYPSDLMFITGHIHLQQSFGNVWCIGTPRHLTRSDIGETKGIQILDFATGENYFTPTPADVFEPFRAVTITDSPLVDEIIKSIADSPKMYVEVKGTREFCKKVSKLLPPSVKVRSTYTDSGRSVTVKESEGIPSTFRKFSDSFFQQGAVDPELRKAILTKVYDKCPSLKVGVK